MKYWFKILCYFGYHDLARRCQETGIFITSMGSWDSFCGHYNSKCGVTREEKCSHCDAHFVDGLKISDNFYKHRLNQ